MPMTLKIFKIMASITMIKPLRFFKLVLILSLQPISNKRFNFLNTMLIRFEWCKSFFLKRGKTFIIICRRLIMIFVVISFFVDNSEMRRSPGRLVKSRPLHFIHFIYYKLKFIITSQSILSFGMLNQSIFYLFGFFSF